MHKSDFLTADLSKVFVKTPVALVLANSEIEMERADFLWHNSSFKVRFSFTGCFFS